MIREKWWGKCQRCPESSDFLAYVTIDGRRFKVCADCYEAARASDTIGSNGGQAEKSHGKHKVTQRESRQQASSS